MDSHKTRAAFTRFSKLLQLQQQVLQREQAQLQFHTRQLESLDNAQADALAFYGTARGGVTIDATLIAARLSACRRQAVHLELEASRSQDRIGESHRRHNCLQRKTSELSKKVQTETAARHLSETIEHVVHKSAASLRR